MTALAIAAPPERNVQPGIDPSLWSSVQRRLVAKALSELAYEEVLQPARTADKDSWRITLGSGVRYRFHAVERIWGNLTIDPGSIERDETREDISIFRFVADAKDEIAMAPADMAWYLRELQNTALADYQLAVRNEDVSCAMLAELPELELHAHLEGHPKAVTSKGRIGWGTEDFHAFAPESGAAFQLVWLAVEREIAAAATLDELSDFDLQIDAMSAEEIDRLQEICAARGISDAYGLVPVHPWQWDNVISQWFVEEIAAGSLVYLEHFGDRFAAQPSLRTLSNVERRNRYDIKLSLSILNTSCYRGIPGRFIPIGPRLSVWLDDLVASDSFLSHEHRTVVLREVAGMHVANKTFERIDDLPYRYHEGLGVIWRERLEQKLEDNERGVMLSALHHQDCNGRPLLAEYIERSGLSPTDWLTKLFDEVTVPLYHFLCRHGVSFIAHGQNISVVLRDWVPTALVVKDFQGDLDLVDRPFEELNSLPDDIRSILTRKRPEIIVHNILTGHFVTVLRFISEVAESSGVLSERAFYSLLAQRLRRYQHAHPELRERFEALDLFAPRFPKVCLNKARYEIGYADSSQRPKPAVGQDLENPLYRFDELPD